MNEQTIFEAVDNYSDLLFNKVDQWTSSVEQRCRLAAVPAMNVSANQGKFLQILARSLKAKYILELGTLGGYSAIWLAKALPADGKLTTIEVNTQYAAIAQENIKEAGVENIVEIKTGKGVEVLELLIKEQGHLYDLIFIDADKPPYAEYLELAIQLSHPGTLIIADNVVRGGKVLDTNSTDEAVLGVQRFNQKLSNDKRVSATIIQNVGAKEHDGMAIVTVL